MNQPSLFEDTRYQPPSLARKTDPQTSKKAAHEFRSSLNDKQVLMLRAITDANEIGVNPTANEAASSAALQHGGMAETYRKRTKELLRLGLLDLRGERRCNITGSTAQTYAAKR